MMQLKLLGTLQDIGYEDAYLHLNVPDNRLFVEISKNDLVRGMSRSLFMQVTKMEIYEYFELKIGLKDMARKTTLCYKWHSNAKAKGFYKKVDKKEALEYFDDVDMFDEDFCKQKNLILYYMNQLDIKSN